jgi:hypothetical protein
MKQYYRARQRGQEKNHVGEKTQPRDSLPCLCSTRVLSYVFIVDGSMGLLVMKDVTSICPGSHQASTTY